MSAFDKIQDEIETPSADNYYGDRSRRRYNLIQALTEKEIKYIFPIENLSREEVIRQTPEEVRKLIHFCRIPNGVVGAKCGRCKTCRHTIKILEKINKEKNTPPI